MNAEQWDTAALSEYAADETQAQVRYGSRRQMLSHAACPLNAIPLHLVARVNLTFLFLRRMEGAACWI